ncbi:MAG: hypothetical protein QNJ22_02605 [Desulfosarcinaceae bacterium]|nr:hypothetical protein [Desulfosarcinaceae bacterium]
MVLRALSGSRCWFACGCLFTIGLVHLMVPWTAAANASSWRSIDGDAMSGDPIRIRQAIQAYERDDTQQPELQWRLIRAYYNYYDELTERGRRDEQRWAAERGFALAATAYARHPDKIEMVYYYGAIGLCYLDFHRVKALFLIDDIIAAFKRARELDPTIDDAGPDRNLGLLYHELPWPLKNRQRAWRHLEAAAQIAPERAANRLPLAKVLAENGRYESGMRHIAFVRKGQFKVSSAHWRAIYLRRVEEIAKEFPPQ